MATKYEWYIVGDDSYETFYDTKWVAQQFTVGTTGSNVNFEIEYIEVKIYDYSGDPKTITAEIYAVDGSGDPTGDILSTGSIEGTDLTNAYHQIDMSSYTLEASTQYILVLKGEGNSSNRMSWRQDAVGSYGGGMKRWTTDSGDTWTGGAGNSEVMFEIWGNLPSTGVQVNIGDAWKAVPLMKINIGDDWKEIASAQINIGDDWKVLF